ncbi:MAG: hypothetical protein ACREOO_21340 [bacterium]
MKTFYSILFILQAGIVSMARAQAGGSAAVPFLTIQPSPRANGMGGTSAAYTGNDPLAIAFNPAQLGHMSLDQAFALELYPSSTSWLPQLTSNLSFDAKTVLLGYPFKGLNRKKPFSFGLAYTRVSLDFGESVITGEDGPEPIGTFHAFERANLWSLGAGVDDLVEAGLGLTLKDIQSNLAPEVTAGGGSASAIAYDFGAVAYVPADEIVARVKKAPIEIGPGLRPFGGIGFGYSQSNIGDKISYIDASQADPLPRTARIGTSLKIGLALHAHDQTWQLLSFEHVHEAEQSLVRFDGSGEVSYDGWLGDIDFWNNVILRKGGAEITSKNGGEFGLAEIVAIRYGHHDDPVGNLIYDTKGIGFSLHGVLKMIRHFNPGSRSEPWLDFMYKHLDVGFNASRLNAKEGHPVTGTEFQSIRISIF